MNRAERLANRQRQIEARENANDPEPRGDPDPRIDAGNPEDQVPERARPRPNQDGLTVDQLAAIVQAMRPIIGQGQAAEPEGRNREGNQFNLKPFGEILDTSTKRGSELYGQATKKMEPIFDGTQENLHTFIDKVRQRAGHLNCIRIFEVPIVGVLGERIATYNLFEDYTNLSLEQVKRTALDRWHENNWLKQASYIMGIAILDSLGDSFRSRIADHNEKYMILENNQNCVDGPCLLKTIYMLVQPETGYSAFTLIQDLNTVSLENHNNNVLELNKEVRALTRRIRATRDGRNSLPDQTIVYYLIQAYEKARCDDFKLFIDQMKNSGIPNLDILITRAEAKYIDLTKSGKWDATPKDEIILALRAKTEALEKKNRKRKSRDSSENKKKRRKGGKQGRRDKPQYENKDEAWMRKEPSKSKLTKVITRDGKQWNWCIHHKKYVLLNGRFGKHTSETCSLNPKKKAKKSVKSEDKRETKIDVNLAEDSDTDENSNDNKSSTTESDNDEKSTSSSE